MAKIDCAQVSEVENPSKRMSSSELILRYSVVWILANHETRRMFYI